MLCLHKYRATVGVFGQGSSPIVSGIPADCNETAMRPSGAATMADPSQSLRRVNNKQKDSYYFLLLLPRLPTGIVQKGDLFKRSGCGINKMS